MEDDNRVAIRRIPCVVLRRALAFSKFCPTGSPQNPWRSRCAAAALSSSKQPFWGSSAVNRCSRPLLGFGRGSSPENQPTRPRRQLAHNVLLTVILTRPSAWATWLSDVPLHLPGECHPTTLWQWPKCPHRGHHNMLRTQWAAMFASNDSREGWRCNICQAHCRSGTEGIASHNLLSFAILSSIFVAVYWSLPIGVPNTVMPSGCHTSCPISAMSGSICLIPCSGFALMQLDARDPHHGFFQHLVQRFNACWFAEQVHIVEKHTTARHRPDVLPLLPAHLGCPRQTTTRDPMVGRTTDEQTEGLPWLLASGANDSTLWPCVRGRTPRSRQRWRWWRSVLHRLQHATCGQRNLSLPALTVRTEKANTRPQTLWWIAWPKHPVAMPLTPPSVLVKAVNLAPNDHHPVHRS